MKHFLLGVSFLLTSGYLTAQVLPPDEENLYKYWRQRDRLREDFVKIGNGDGNSIVARGLKPLDCVDNINDDGTGFGVMHWGDGMIRHGYYLGLLATEYRLLKDAGEDVSGVLNELYYALKAINRLDYAAEQEQSAVYEFTQEPQLNGYYMREDIPQDFAFENWGNARINARCDDSPHYRNNNAAKTDDGTDDGQGLWALGNSYQNVPSNDQLSALMVGFSLIHKLVESTVYVKPPPEEEGFYIVAETQAIVNRMMTYLDQHNCMMIDVNGWPVNNQGGDILPFVYPLYVAAQRITGVNYSFHWNRRIQSFDLQSLQFCITGYGLENNDPDQRIAACGEIPVTQLGSYNLLLPGEQAGPDNNQDFSTFQLWLLGGGLEGSRYFLEEVWNNPQLFVADLSDDGMMSSLEFPLNQVKLFKKPAGENDESNWTIIANYVVSSGLWNSAFLGALSNMTGNIQAELINSVIRNDTPANSKEYYRDFLTAMEQRGPYNLVVKGTNYGTKMQKSSPDGWASEHRWTWSSSAEGTEQSTGIFNGLDYLLFHNLYYLKFGQSLPHYEVKDDCLCQSNPQVSTSPPTDLSTQEAVEYVQVAGYLNQKLTFLPSCSKNVFQSVNNVVSSTFDVYPYFPSYSAIKIYPTQFQLANTTIQSGGTVNTWTRFNICDANVLTIQAGGVLDVKVTESSLQHNARIDCSGDIFVRDNATLRIGVGGKLVLKNGGRIFLGENAKLIIEKSGSLEYYSGGQVFTSGSSQIILRGGIRIMDNSEFSIIHNGIIAGKIIADGEPGLYTLNANQGKFKLTGKDKTDLMMVLTPGTKLTLSDGRAQLLTLINGKVEMGAGSSFDIKQPLVASQVSFVATADNEGMLTTQNAAYTNCDFVNVPVNAIMNIEYSGTLSLQSCNSTATIETLTAPALVNVLGQGYTITNCEIKGRELYSVKSSSLTLASTLSGSTLAHEGTLPSGQIYYGVYDNSNIELTVKRSTLTNCYMGVCKSFGKTTLRCNMFTGNKNVNVQSVSGELNANSANGGGYNTFYKTSTRKNIAFSGVLNMKNGYNYIEQGLAGQTITGNVPLNVFSVDISNNQWSSANTVPSNIGYITGQSVGSLPIIVSPVAAQQSCPLNDGPVPPGGGDNKSYSLIPLVYSATLGDSIKLDDLYYLAAENMSAYSESVHDDELALSYLSEMFGPDLDKSDSITAYWLSLGQSEMKKTLENAFTNNLLSKEDNSLSYDPVVTKYVSCLTYMTDSVIDENNFLQQFHNEIDKAHLFRVLGHTQIGLDILEELESCGIDSLTQGQLNFWKVQFESERLGQLAGVESIDSVIVVDTSGFILPALAINGFSFGANIEEMQQITYPNCGFFNRSALTEARSGLKVYPNPARDYVTLTVDNSGKEINCELLIDLSNGKNVFSESVRIPENGGYTLKIQNWSPGIYMITLIMPDGNRKQATLAVQ